MNENTNATPATGTPMNLDTALGVVDQVLASFQGTRKDHQIIAEAMDFIRKALKK